MVTPIDVDNDAVYVNFSLLGEPSATARMSAPESLFSMIILSFMILFKGK